MARHMKRISALAALALMAGVLITGPEASAAPRTVKVREATPLFKKAKAPAEGMLFYAPRPLRVHAGDTIKFNIRGFHTATLTEANTPIKQWVAGTAGPGDPYSLLVPDPDDPGGGAGRPALKFNDAAAFPSDPNCGTLADPCAYNGNSVVNSGVTFGPSRAFSIMRSIA